MLRRARPGQTGRVGTFESGIELNAAFYAEVVAPILSPWAHSAGLLGWGSEILGFDTERSTDHGWGPRLRVFVEPPDVVSAQAAIDAALPSEFRSRPVTYGWDGVAAEHRVREHLDWYPDDVWRWMVACQWQRVAQEEAFVGRTAEVGDELGSRLVAARQVHELMRLWFLFHRRYWPYMKWFGSAFARLPGAAELNGHLARVLQAADWQARQRALAAAYEFVARGHNDAGITEWVDPTVRPFFGRGFLVLMSDRFVEACLERVTDPWLRALPLLGSVDQLVDSTDLLSVAARATQLRALYEAEPAPDVHGDPDPSD